MLKMPETPSRLVRDAALTEACLDAIFTHMRAHMCAHMRDAAAAPRLIEAMAWSTLGGGKRVRGGLVLGAARLAAGVLAGADMPHERETPEGADMPHEAETPDGAVRVAAAFECLHAYSLIHDDLPAMDDAALRRGKPACHIQFDEATAILAGDALQALAFALLADPATHSDGAVRAALVACLAKAAGAGGMAGGQMLDLEAETRRFDLAETARMQRLKTGALMGAAVRAGGIHGGAEAGVLAALEGWGEAVGLAFQITDDVLDRSATAGSMGKPTGRDDMAHKASYVTLMGREAAMAEAQRLVDEGNAALIEAVESAGAGASRAKGAGAACPTPGLDYMLELSGFIMSRQN